MNFKKLEEFLDHLTSWRIPGCDCTVHIGYDEVFRYQSGYADIESKTPMTPDRTYCLYSAGKVITCAAGMTLFEQGKFLFNDPLWEYIPSFKEMYVKTADGELVKAKNEIKVRDIFMMTAGLTYDVSSPSIKKVREENGDNCTTAQIVDAIANEPLIYEPGTFWSYSLGHDVVGRLIEVVSGKTFGEYLQEALFDPLDMKDTGFELTSDRLARMASKYRYIVDEDRLEKTDHTNVYKISGRYESGGAGLVSTVNDYIKFADAMANGGVGKNGNRILTNASIDLMRTNHLTEKTYGNFGWKQNAGYGYGLGVRTMVDKAAGDSLSSVGEFGWGGAAGAYAMIDPSKKMAIFYAQHLLNNQEPYVHPRIRNLVYYGLEQ